MQASTSSRILRSACKRLGYCCYDNNNHGLTAGPSSVPILAAALHFQEVPKAPKGIQATAGPVPGSISAVVNHQNNPPPPGVRQMGDSTSGSGGGGFGCFSLRLAISVLVIAAALMFTVWLVTGRPDYATIAKNFGGIMDLSRIVWSTFSWFYRFYNYCADIRHMDNIFQLILMWGRYLLSSSSNSVSHNNNCQADMDELRSAVTRLEQRISALETRLLDQSVPTTDNKLATTAEWTQQELAQLRSNLDSLTKDMKSPDTIYQMLEKRLDHLKQQVASLMRSPHFASVPLTPEADLMPDFALASGGAQVVSTLDSKSPGVDSVSGWWCGWWRQRRQLPGPDTALTPTVQAGSCWAFAGFPGRLLVQLGHAIRISAVSIDHLSRLQTYNNSLASAPRQFSVYGLTGSSAGRDGAEKLGSFTYDAEAGPPTQTFRLAEATTAVYKFVELDIHSNHGNDQYTCLYRFRVHGQIP